MNKDRELAEIMVICKLYEIVKNKTPEEINETIKHISDIDTKQYLIPALRIFKLKYEGEV